MQGLYASDIGIHAEIEYRRRQIIALGRPSRLAVAPRRSFRVTLAEILAHVALHLDGRAAGSVAEQHAQPSGHGHARAA